MPSHAPRTDTTKKLEQLARRRQELEHAVRTGLSRAQVLSAADALKAANLSLLKAELHWAEEARIKVDDAQDRVRVINLESQKWLSMTPDEIADQVVPA